MPVHAALIVGLGLAPAAAAGQSAIEAMNAPERALARAADADGNGEVSAQEWADFVALLGGAEDGALDPRRAAALALRPLLDADGDGVFTIADVNARLTAVDLDGSGTLSRAELEATYQGGSASLLDGLIAFGLDQDGDLEVSAAEWAAAVASPSAPGSRPLDESLLVWLAQAETFTPEDRGAIAPSVFLATFRAGLDFDRDGRFDRDDLAAHFAALDADGNGALSADELAPPAASPRPQAFVPEPLAGGPREPRMPWERSLEDALLLSRTFGKPLLLCVNMDGEAASESLARGRYTDPEFARLAAGFIPLLASPDRHSARDHDGRGARIADPRFGRLVEQEHIDIEPALFERYFAGNRVAPRHVGVSPEGQILFDIYLVNDPSILLERLEQALAEHGNFETALPDPTTLDEDTLLATPSASARALLEARFLGSADESERIRLTARALDPAAPIAHPELVRMALRDPARAVRGQALASIAGAIERVPVALVPEALRAAEGVPERRPQLAAALARRAATAEGQERVRLRRLGRIAAAVELDSPVIELASWQAALAGAGAAPRPPRPAVEALLEALDAVGQRKKREPDEARLDALFARTALRAARVMIESGEGNPGFLLEDSRAAAERAAAALPDDPSVQAVLASTAHQLGDFETAGAAAARALAGLLGFAELEVTAEVLNVFADTRVRALYERLGSEEGWPATWVGDVVAAYEVLLLHPHGSEEQVLAGLEALGSLELFAEQGAFLRRALARYPTSPKLHEFLRWQALRDGDVGDLAAVYEPAQVDEWARAAWFWYAGLAYLVAAERRVADGDPGGALEVYGTSVARLRSSVELEPQYEDSAAHYEGLAWSGVSKVLLDRGDLEGAIEALRASAEANAAGFANPDGLGNTAQAVARALVQVLRRTDRAEEAGELGRFLNEQGVDL